MKSCLEFRVRLGAALEGKLSGAPLAWHEHLVGCSSCRELFAAEEALDELLACLPEPALPVALARRVLRRLESDRELDRALDLALGGEAAAPAGLAARIVGRVDGERRAASRTLDELLDTQVAPKLPADLAETVLAGLERELAPPILRPVFGGWQRAAAMAAAVLVVGLLWRLLPDEDKHSPTTEALRIAMSDPELSGAPIAPSAKGDLIAEAGGDSMAEPGSMPDPELLASLDLLEDWELLVPTDIDLLLGSLDESDAELLLLDASSLETAVDTEQSEG